MRVTLKKTMLFSVILMLVWVTAACGGGGNTPAQESKGSPSASAGESPTGKPYEGTTLKVFFSNLVWANEVTKLIPEFEEATGIKIDLESLFEEQLKQKLSVQFTSGSSSPDVFMYLTAVDQKMFNSNGWMEPLDAYLKDDAEYDLSDYSPAIQDAVSDNGSIVGLPVATVQHILYYRKDLLEEKNLPVPTTLEQLLATAEQLHDPANDFYGYAARGTKETLTFMLSSFMFSEGADFIADGKAALDTPEALEAYRKYTDLLLKAGPPAPASINWPQAQALFTEGKAAFFPDASGMVGSIIDPQKAVAGKVGFAQFPAGSNGSKPFNVVSWAIGMNAASKNKDAAALFMKWLTSKDVTLRTQQAGAPGGRTSVWASPEGTKAFPEQLVQVIQESQKSGVGYWSPRVTRTTEANDAVGTIIADILTGKNPEETAKKQNAALQKIIDAE